MKKRILSIVLAFAMIMSILPSSAFSAAAATILTDIVVDSSIGSDNNAVISATETTQGQFYAILGNNGVITTATVSGATKGNNGWYKANSANGVSFSGIDPAQMPFQIVCKDIDTQTAGTNATSVTNGTAVGNCVYYYYVANDNSSDGCSTLGSEYNSGTKAAPFLTVQNAIDKVNTNEYKQQGVVVLLDDSTLDKMICIPLHYELTQEDGKNITITSDSEQHKIIRNFTNETTTIQTFTGSKLVLDNVTVDDNQKHNPFSTVFVDPYSTMIMRGNSKLINGANRGVNIRANATFIMESGEISGNTAGANIKYHDNYTGQANAGGGVYICPAYNNQMVGGTFIMTGGKITGNKASVGAAGIFGEAGTTIKISGDAVVTDNTNTATSQPSNIFLNDNQKITLTGPLSDKANLGVYVTNMPTAGQPDVPVAVSDGSYIIKSSDVRAFSSDKATTAGIKMADSQIVMSADAKANEMTISGKVSDYVGGSNTLSGITVSLYDAEDSTFARPLASAETDTNGNYTINATVKSGNYVTHINEKESSYNGSTSAVTAISGSDVTGVDIVLTKGAQSITIRKTGLNLSISALVYESNTGETVTANPITSDITNSGEGWVWYRYANASKGYGAYTLELNGIDFDVKSGRGITAIIPEGITIIVNGENKITTYSQQGMSNGAEPYYPMALKSTTDGTLDITVKAPDMSAIVAGGLTTENVNFNVTCSQASRSALNSTNAGAGGVLQPLVFNGGTANLYASNQSDSGGLRGSSITVKGGAVITCSGNYGINGESIDIQDGIIHSIGTTTAFRANPTLGNGLYAIDNINNKILASGTDLTQYKDVVIISGNTEATITVSSDTPADITSVIVYNGTINIPLSSIGNNQYQGKIASGTYNLKINGKDCGKSFTASDNQDLSIDVYKLILEKSEGISAVSASDYYIAGGNATVEAQLNAGYTFNLWKSSNTTAVANGKTNPYTFVMPSQSITMTASAKAENSGKGSVTLNKAVFNSDKTGYSFKSAAINDFDGVTSITFSATKSTTVLSIPTNVTPNSTLESIDGETRTATYVFENGISVSQAEEFIRGIVLEYKAGAEISITVDNNQTNLPNGATITEYNHSDGTSHYYMFVPTYGAFPWASAYNAAKSYRYMGMIGYLTTITSQEEDEVLTNISKSGAWSGGSRMLKSNGELINDDSSYENYTYEFYNKFYWTCGPEAGTVYFNGTTYSDGTSPSGVYNNWQSGEPNDDVSSGLEQCMQVNFTGEFGGLEPKWNDINNAGSNFVNGYFVEFSNYAGGLEPQQSSDKTAISTYDLETDGIDETIEKVKLNAPVYLNGDKSIFSFDNAEIIDINTIYSITIKLDNYTNVYLKPEAPAVSNELNNIAGDTNTITYQFENGITLAEAQSFLRGIKFRYGGLKDSSTTNVSVTVDGNRTDLPQGASITEYNGHYYMYVPVAMPWNQAYNEAKSYYYMGLRGYLATITSAEEDSILTQISNKGAWSGGCRMLKSDGNMILDDNSYSLYTYSYFNQYYWACGPEAGLVYFTGITAATGSTPVGIYNNWLTTNNVQAEPNNYSGTNECCMQVNYSGSAGLYKKWNDLRCNPTNGTGYEVTGYFVEFSDYEGGRAEDYSASVTGKSSVPISVEKGDIFNSIKDGGTYYVDTILTAFDRNIVDINVNGSSVSNGYKLLGNMNYTHTIIATDLGGNTATTKVYMKTIASISEPIKDLTVDNVKTSDIEAILEARATLRSIDQTTASTAQKTEIATSILNCNYLYFALFNATPTAINGTNDWYKSGIDTITLTAPDGFTISTSENGDWTSAITIDKTDSANKTAKYYLKETSTSEISPLKTFTYKVDTTAPTGTITIKNNNFTSFIRPIGFEMFYKNTVDVNITGNDTLSTPVTISYQKLNDGENYDLNGKWVDGSSFFVNANEKFSVYAKIADKAGNTIVINSKGVVVYTDSLKNTADIEFTKTSTKNVNATVELNGNTVNEIKNGDKVINNTNYTVSQDGVITFKASYLNSLAIGNYTFTISYNPMGESFVQEGNNQAPSTTTLSLAVKAISLTDKDGNLDSCVTVSVSPKNHTYDGKAFAPTVTVKYGDKTLTAETDYIVSWISDMINVGEKTATITFKGAYSGTTTKKVNITNAALTDTTNKTQSVTFNGKAQSISEIPSAVTVNNQKVTVKYSTDGTDYSLTAAPTFTKEGTYTVYYQLSARNHDTKIGQITFKINANTGDDDNDIDINDMITLPDYNSKGWHNKDIVITAKDGFTLCKTENGDFGNTLTISKESGKTGSEFTFYIKSASGKTYKKSLNYKLDKSAPTGAITIGNSTVENILTNITFGLLFSNDVDVTATSSDSLSGVAKMEVYKSDKALTKEELSNANWNEYTDVITESAKDKEKFIYYARITDNAGNVVIVNSQGAEFDLTAPVVDGITDGETYYTTHIITVDDEDVTITVNGEEFENGGEIFGDKDETYKIVITDKAGNITELTIYTKKIADISDLLNDINEDNVKDNNQKDIDNIKKKAESIDVTNATKAEKEAIQQIIDKCDLLLKKIADNSDDNENPYTGDNSNNAKWVALLFVSGGTLTTLGITKKRKKANSK